MCGTPVRLASGSSRPFDKSDGEDPVAGVAVLVDVLVEEEAYAALAVLLLLLGGGNWDSERSCVATKISGDVVPIDDGKQGDDFAPLHLRVVDAILGKKVEDSL